MIASFFCMYQSTFIKDIYRNHLIKQILWFLIGFIILIFLQKVKIKFFFHYSSYLYWLSVILLGLVLVFGKEINGARAWFAFKSFNFQPSEFAKITILLYLSKVTNDFYYSKVKNEFFYICKCFLIVLIPSILVFLEPDTGAILFYFLLLLAVLFLSGIHKYWFILSFIILIIVGGTFVYLYLFQQEILINLIGTSFFYRVDRLLHFSDGTGLQLNNALITIGNAGFLGHGIIKSLLYVPEFPTDFVFTLSISIFGFLGGCIILFCYLILNYFFISKLSKVKNMDYKYFLHGFVYLFLFQQIQNIFMNLGLLPIMGIPLPFMSYGGSNMLVYFIFIGFILNILKNKNLKFL